jgi:TonB family protein
MLLEGQSEAKPLPRRYALWASVAAHGALLAWILHAPAPIFVAPSEGLAGVHGNAVTHLYWLAQSGDASELHPAPPSPHATRPPAPHLVLPKTQITVGRPATDVLAEAHSPVQDSDKDAASTPGASAGNPYGSLSEGRDAGHDVRPALPVFTFEPVVDRSQLPGGVEANCIVEITIDEAGNVVAQSVVESMGAAIDTQVLSAVSHWRFRPATRDGVPIPSKQDVVYHFKPS